MLNKHIKYINNLSDENLQELINICNSNSRWSRWNINKNKIKYIPIVYNSIYPCINTFHFIKNISKYNYNIVYLKKILNNPFLHPIYQNSFQNYSYYLRNKTNTIYESKIFWNNFFLKYNANTPIIKAIIINGNVIINYSSILNLLEHDKNNPTKILNSILTNDNNIINKDMKNYDTIFKNSIIKPNYGSRGTGIEAYINHNSIPTKEGIFILQEKIKNIKYNGHFRITTYWNKENNTHEILYTYLFIQKNKNKLLSNGKSSTHYEVKDDSVRKLTDKNYDTNIQYFGYSYSVLKTALNKSIELHKKLNAIMIGWDVKLTDENYYFFEGNFGPGNIFFYDYYYLDKLDFVSKIKYE
jgi:hypothetical protein